MIQLHQFKTAWGLPNPSPFCMKVETYLRMTGIPYEIITDPLPFKAPKKKLPYIEDNGKIIADSGFILDYLKATYGDPLDADLTPPERATAHAIRIMLEEHLYWILVYSRWCEEQPWQAVKQEFFGGMPPVVRSLVPLLARHKVRRTLWLQGIGRHQREEIYALGRADLGALADFLGAQPYLLGERPRSVDAIAYAFLAAIVKPPLPTPLQETAQSHANLLAYCERMAAQYYQKQT